MTEYVVFKLKVPDHIFPKNVSSYIHRIYWDLPRPIIFRKLNEPYLLLESDQAIGKGRLMVNIPGPMKPVSFIEKTEIGRIKCPSFNEKSTISSRRGGYFLKASPNSHLNPGMQTYMIDFATFYFPVEGPYKDEAGVVDEVLKFIDKHEQSNH